MTTVLDVEGRPIEPVSRAEADMEAQIAETIYGGGPDQHVHDLRRSVLGDEAGPGMAPFAGLSAWLP
jgi:hypothetical protein